LKSWRNCERRRWNMNCGEERESTTTVPLRIVKKKKDEIHLFHVMTKQTRGERDDRSSSV
jgi:hypothetical protein